MAISENDNRIQLPPTKVDFDDVVGTTGQAHDTFPDAGQQPRYDWMRMFLIGLLSLQSSEEPPTQYRTGTLWFNRSVNAIYVWDGSAWVSLAQFILVSEDVNLLQWYEDAQPKLNAVQPQMTFSGTCQTSGGVTRIRIPTTVYEALVPDVFKLVRPLVYINGILVDPRLTEFATGCPTEILLLGGLTLQRHDQFSVIITRFDVFDSDTVVV